MIPQYRKPTNCPECKATDIRFIVRGRPSEEGWQMIQDNLAVAGGCFVQEGMHIWRCMNCNHEFSDETDPAMIELRQLEKSVLRKHKS